jgi:hypothetical protein
MQITRRTSLTVALLATLLVAAGCGASTAAQASTATALAHPTATAAPSVAHAGQSAAQLGAGLKTKGLPIGEVVVYTDATDLNHLLGRPGQYISKCEWVDTRVPPSGNTGVNISVEDGGSIETFATTADGARRLAFIQALASNSVFAEYDYVDGLAFLRLSKVLTPPQAQAYLAAFKTLP